MRVLRVDSPAQHVVFPWEFLNLCYVQRDPIVSLSGNVVDSHRLIDANNDGLDEVARKSVSELKYSQA